MFENSSSVESKSRNLPKLKRLRHVMEREESGLSEAQVWLVTEYVGKTKVHKDGFKVVMDIFFNKIDHSLHMTSE